jgi:hypothetical protein
MRKLDPDLVRSQFDYDAKSLMAFMGHGRRALQGAEHEKSDISQLASTTFLTLYVAFEKFQSDLFLAYLNRDFSRYQSDIEAKISSSVRKKYGQGVERRTFFTSVKHIRVSDLQGIVDPTGWNLTFRDTGMMKDRATQWLAQDHASRIKGLSDHDARLVDTAKSIRDFIAHGSASSKERMNQNLSTVAQGNHNQFLGRSVQEVHNVVHRYS